MIYTMTLNPAIDYVMHPLTLDMGFTNRSSSEEIYCGGNGINVSTLLKELKVPNVALGLIAGFTGDYMLQMLQDTGLTCNFVRLDKGFTRINVKLIGIAMTMVNGMGPKISEKKVDELLERIDGIKEGDTLVLTGSIPKSLPENMYEIIMRRLKGRGIRFVVDAPGTLLLQSLDAEPFLIKPNNPEVGRISATSSSPAAVTARCCSMRTAASTPCRPPRSAWSTRRAPATPWSRASSPRSSRAPATRTRLSLRPHAVPPRQPPRASQSAPRSSASTAA